MAALSSVTSVKALVPDAIFKRGKEIAASNKLHHVTFEGPAMDTAAAMCAGSNEGEMYRLSLSINVEETSKPKCECSCPAAAKFKGGLCKHLVALLLFRIKELGKRFHSSANAKVADEEIVEEVRQTSTSDSQLTEPWVDPEVLTFVENIPTPSASFTTRGSEGGRNRILPAWMVGKPLPGVAEDAQKKGKGSRGPNSKLKEKTVSGHSDDDGARGRGHRRGLAKASLSNKRRIGTSRGKKRFKIDESETSDEDIGEVEDQEDLELQRITNRQDCDFIEEEVSGNYDDCDDALPNGQLMACQNLVKIEKGDRRASKDESLSRQPRKSSRWVQADSDLSDEDMDKEYEIKQERISSTSGRQTRGAAIRKRKKTGPNIVGKSKIKGVEHEEDRIEEDIPEVGHEVGTKVSHDSSKIGLKLTTEDLISMAKKHLKGAEGNTSKDAGDFCQQENLKDKNTLRKIDSIFSAQEWNAISTVPSDAKDSVNEKVFERKNQLDIDNMKLDRRCNDGRNGNIEEFLLSRSEERREKSPKTADNVAEDMLNLLFGPSLCAAASLGNTQMSQNETTLHPIQIDVADQMNSNLTPPPIRVEALKPKKKGSLKDKVMMFLS